MKIALIGATGQLGTDLKKVFRSDEIVELNYPEFDLTKKELVREKLGSIKPDTVINTAAYNLVERAEQLPEEAMKVNFEGVSNLVEVCKKYELTLVHFSTDFVFGADDQRSIPYIESDTPAPINEYGVSKLKGEKEVSEKLTKYFLIRTAYLFGSAGSMGKGGNIVESLIKKGRENKKLEAVDDQTISPTYSLDLAKQVKKLIETDKYGLYHAAGLGECTIAEFAKCIFKCLNEEINIVPIKSSSLSSLLKRPHYSVLENKKLIELGLNVMRTWELGVSDYLKEKKYK